MCRKIFFAFEKLCISGGVQNILSLRKKIRKSEWQKGGAPQSYHSLGAAAVQGDVCSQVCVVVVDGTGGAVELQFSQVNVNQGGDREHQSHLCIITRQLCRQTAAAGSEIITKFLYPDMITL